MDGFEQMIIMSQALPSHTETDDHVDDQAVRTFRLPNSYKVPHISLKYELKFCVSFRTEINPNPLHNEVAMSSQV